MRRESLLTRAAAVAQVCVDDVDAPVLRDDDAHHLTKVLRVRSGERVIVTNGSGSWTECEWRNGSLAPVSAAQQEEAPTRPVLIAFALTKADKPEWTVQKLTEIGVDRIVPVMAERSVVRWDADKTRKNVERFRRVAHEAAMQCRRVYLPIVDLPVAVRDLPLDDIALAAPGGEALRSDGNVNAIAVGPEGGWTDAEIALARRTVDLGPTILRAETAALSAAVQLCTARG